MGLQCDVADGDLVRVAEAITKKVNRSALQQALLESRLLPRPTDREEVKKLARATQQLGPRSYGTISQPWRRGPPPNVHSVYWPTHTSNFRTLLTV
jgi:hypothetical protein